MSYAAHNRDFMPVFAGGACGGSKSVANRPGVVRRILNRIFEWRQQQADREIARFVDRAGGRFTDEMEREMTQRLLRGNWNPN
jgi:hypothetical protein